MRRQLLVNGALFVLALGTLGVVWATRDVPTTAELSARKEKLFPSYQRADISRLWLERDDVKVELVRDASAGVQGDFRIVTPWQERADIGAVSALLGALDLANFLRPADGVDRVQAGLGSPRLTLTFEQRGERHTVKLGGPAPAPAGAAYAEVQLAGQPARLFTISAGVVAELDVTPDGLRDPRLLEVSRHDLTRLVLRHGSRTVELSQSEGTELPRMLLLRRSGEPELVSRDRLERVLTALARLVAAKLVDSELARRGVAADPDRLVLELERAAKAGPPITVTLGGSCIEQPEQRLALVEERGRPARAGCVDAQLAEDLRVNEDELVISTLFSARPDEVEELELEGFGQAQPLALKRDGSAFKLRAGKTMPVALDAGNRLLERLLGAEGKRQPQRATSADTFQAGRARVELNRSDEARSFEQVRFAKPRPDGSVCARRELDSVVLCIDAEQAKLFEPDPTTLRPLRVVDFAAAELTSLQITRMGVLQRVERTEAGTFALREPPGFSHDGALVTDAVQALGALEAERWVAAKPQPEHGLTQPWLQVRAQLTDRGAVELQVGAATAGGYFAKLADDPPVFVLARSALRAFESPLIDRSLVPLPADQIATLELVQGSRRVTLTRQDQAWTAEGLAPGKAQRLGEAILALRAQQALRLGPARPADALRPALTFVAKSGQRYTLELGATDVLGELPIVLARVSGVDATFALAASTAQALRDF